MVSTRSGDAHQAETNATSAAAAATAAAAARNDDDFVDADDNHQDSAQPEHAAADQGTRAAPPRRAARGPTDFIPMRDATLSSHQHALTTQEIAHREAYPHVREARANIASRRVAAAATQHRQQQQQQQQQRVTTAPSPEWKVRPDPGTRDTSEPNKTRWDVPEYTPPTADFSPTQGILQNHNSGLPPSRRDDATARPPSAAQTATQQATRERAQQPAGL
ncbi:hypothetical protein RI054_01g04410 [Pseudoscourfieldia marina]